MSSCIFPALAANNSLEPKAPRKDLSKMVANQGVVLRFSAELVNEPNRSFVVSFFCADDTVSVTERAGRNSGYQTGKFLDRTQVLAGRWLVCGLRGG